MTSMRLLIEVSNIYRPGSSYASAFLIEREMYMIMINKIAIIVVILNVAMLLVSKFGISSVMQECISNMAIGNASRIIRGNRSDEELKNIEEYRKTYNMLMKILIGFSIEIVIAFVFIIGVILYNVIIL